MDRCVQTDLDINMGVAEREIFEKIYMNVLERENELQENCDEGALYQGTDLSIHKTIKMQK